jgi:hypothetical protein
MRREIAIKARCPKCEALAGSPCIGRRGARKSMHQARADVAEYADRTRPKSNPAGYVYFIRCAKTKLVKIGFTESYPTNRLRQLQTGSGGKLHLIAFITARANRERELHRQFALHHERGEWFRLEGSFADWLRELDV